MRLIILGNGIVSLTTLSDGASMLQSSLTELFY